MYMKKEANRVSYPNTGLYKNIENQQLANNRKQKDSFFISHYHEELQKIADSCFKKSGVKVDVSSSGFSFNPIIDNSYSDKNIESNEDLLNEVFNRLRNYIGNSESNDPKIWISTLSNNDKILLRNFLKNKNKGGIGITGRNLDQIKDAIPQLFSFFKNNHLGKFVSLGNGFSSLPLDMIKDGSFNIDQVVVSDLFSYEVFFQELSQYIEQIKKKFSDHEDFSIPYVLEHYHDLLEKIILESKNGDGQILISKPHFLGDNRKLPEDLANSDVVFNYMGAPQSTLVDQVKMLSDKGILFFAVKGRIEVHNIPVGYSLSYLGDDGKEFIQPIPDANLQVAKITRNS